MRDQIKQWLNTSLSQLQADGVLSHYDTPQVSLARQREHGDYSSNIALMLAANTHLSPRALAEQIVAKLPHSDSLAKVQIAGPGFINFYLKKQAYSDVVLDIIQQSQNYGRAAAGSRGRALLEFVSANPTGPLHIGHGRGAVFGTALANLLQAVGYQVEREYYVNDCGRQMEVLALSVWLRYLELCGSKKDVEFPAKAYQGDYVWDMAAQLHRTHNDRFSSNPRQPLLAEASSDAVLEQHLDTLIKYMKETLGTLLYSTVYVESLNIMLSTIKKELKLFGVQYDHWFHESVLAAKDKIDEVISRLETAGTLYEKDGARWFRSTDFGDEKDRVLVRANGQATYFASDIAYHLNKYQRGYALIINIWGADHHGYLARLVAAMKALGQDTNKLHTLLVQFVNLYKEGQKTAMSTRGGQFIPLATLRKEVGREAMFLFYLMRKHAQHIDFDVAVAKSQTSDNPMYYLQYAYARICSVFKLMGKQGYQYPTQPTELNVLTESEELNLMKSLSHYPQVLAAAADAKEPYLLLEYLKELATYFHSYYNNHRFLVDDNQLRDARLSLIMAVRCVLLNGLTILGISAPEQM